MDKKVASGSGLACAAFGASGLGWDAGLLGEEPGAAIRELSLERMSASLGVLPLLRAVWYKLSNSFQS